MDGKEPWVYFLLLCFVNAAILVVFLLNLDPFSFILGFRFLILTLMFIEWGIGALLWWLGKRPYSIMMFAGGLFVLPSFIALVIPLWVLLHALGF